MYCDWPVLKRCCFCLPLRKGILVTAYLNVLFCGFLVGVYSYAVHASLASELVYRGTTIRLPAELCVIIYLMDLGFNILLIYGAHKRIQKFVKMYYYFAIVSNVTSFVVFFLELVTAQYSVFVIDEIILFGFVGVCIQLYLLILVWSLLKKFGEDDPNGYENQLHQIIDRQGNVDTDPVINCRTIPHKDIV